MKEIKFTVTPQNAQGFLVQFNENFGAWLAQDNLDVTI